MTIQQRIRNAVILFVVTAFVVYATQRPKQESLSFSGETMGTTYSIKYLSTDKSSHSVSRMKRQVDGLLQDINQQMSTYDSESELSRFNSTDSTDWFEVSLSTVQVVVSAMEAAKLSGGKFDPTVGPLVDLWNFGPNREQFEVPSDDVVQSRREPVGYQKIEFRNKPPALKKTNPKTQLDLSAIAKGHAVDRVSELLLNEGIKSHLVEIGGEMRCAGRKPDGKLWTLAIEKPIEGLRGIQVKFETTDSAIATSGNYRNFYIKDGKRYSHTIDPITARPVAHQLASATVLADDCMTADAYATTLMVLGPGDGYNWAVENDVAALLLIYENGKINEMATPKFENLTGKRK